MTDSLISHAIVLDDAEIEQLRLDPRAPIHRRSATSLRMRVAFFRRGSTTVVGTAELREALADQERSSARWQFGDVTWLPSPLAVSTSKTGPIWIRLRQQAREALRAILAVDTQEVYATASSEPQIRHNSGDEEFELVDGPQTDGTEIDLGVDTTASAVGSLSSSDVELGAAPEKDPEALADPVEAARSRANAFVPSHAVDADEARRILVRLRDEEIKPAFPEVAPASGILRRAMLQSFLEEGVASRDDYLRLVPVDLRAATNKTHVAAYLDPILAILGRAEDTALARTVSAAAPAAERPSSETSGGWTDAELWAVVSDYAEMLNCEANGVPFNKAARIRQLRAGPLRERTATSITLRWQNISNLLSKGRRPYVSGLKPAFFGDGVERRLADILIQHSLL